MSKWSSWISAAREAQCHDVTQEEAGAAFRGRTEVSTEHRGIVKILDSPVFPESFQTTCYTSLSKLQNSPTWGVPFFQMPGLAENVLVSAANGPMDTSLAFLLDAQLVLSI